MKFEKGDRLRILLNLPRGGEELEETSNILEGVYVCKEKLGLTSKILKLCDVRFRGMKSQTALVPLMFIRKTEKIGKENVESIEELPAFEELIVKSFFKISTAAFGFYIARYNTFFEDHSWNLLINGNTMASSSVLLSYFVPRSPLEAYTDYVISVEYGKAISEIIKKMNMLRKFIDYSVAKAGCLIIIGKDYEEETIDFAKTRFFDMWICEDLGTTKSSLNAMQGTKYICGALVDLRKKEFYIPEKVSIPKVLFNILKNTIPRTLKHFKDLS